MTSSVVKYNANYNIALTVIFPRTQIIPLVSYFPASFCSLYNAYNAHDAIPREILARKGFGEDINKTMKEVKELFHDQNTKNHS
jgi:hypothetical protein